MVTVDRDSIHICVLLLLPSLLLFLLLLLMYTCYVVLKLN